VFKPYRGVKVHPLPRFSGFTVQHPGFKLYCVLTGYGVKTKKKPLHSKTDY